MRRFVVLVFLASAAVVPLAAAPAQAQSCGYTGFLSKSGDYARATDATGGCTQVGARHEYNPVWSGNDYWTSWKYGGNYAQDATAAEAYLGDYSGY